MKNTLMLLALLVLIALSSIAFKRHDSETDYISDYNRKLKHFSEMQKQLTALVKSADLNIASDKTKLLEQINAVRIDLKGLDFWLRYLEPITYRKINGPLPVEWETEVFEKFEKPYRREGAGLTLAALYLEEENISRDSISALIQSAFNASKIYAEDSITIHLKTFEHFYLCNRLFLLNLSTIYTTGFECPTSERIIPELRMMLQSTLQIYRSYNNTFKQNQLSENYLKLYENAITFVNNQTENFEEFDHFTFIKDFINPLYSLNQQLISDYKVRSKSFVDYSLNNNSSSIFSKSLYRAQNTKGIFSRINDAKTLLEVELLGKLLFFDPILSGNNERSCASCHQPNAGFTDTLQTTSLQFNKTGHLTRNTPTLLNAQFNHLIMLDGIHTGLQAQAKAVISNPLEMACEEKELLKKVLSCSVYKEGFSKLLKYTPQEPKISMEHIASALTHYYSKFSLHEAPFDEAMNNKTKLNADEIIGFNIFMGKAQCATCHFVPQFNGVKPPYVGSEFEVLGVPADTSFKKLSEDHGRFLVNPAVETKNAFRTGTVRNSSRTKPYMHNGVFRTMEEVIDFYDAGGGAGRGLTVPNQTLSSDSLHLTSIEKKQLIAFIKTLDEKIPTETAPESLPISKIKTLNNRPIGGNY